MVYPPFTSHKDQNLFRACHSLSFLHSEPSAQGWSRIKRCLTKLQEKCLYSVLWQSY